MHSISLWADAEAAQELLNVLQVPAAQAQRVAAEALGRIGSRLSSGINYENGGKVAEENSLNWIVPGLLTAGADEHDRVLEHSITYALIETDIPLGTAEGLNSSSVYEQRTALIAMDQMEHGQVHASQVVPLLDSPEPVLRQTAWWVASHHPDWGGALAGFFKERLAATNLTEDGCGELRTQLAHFAGGPEIQNLLPTSLEAPETKPAVRILLLQAMADADPKQPPPHWVGTVRSCLSSKEAALLPAAVTAAKSLSQVKTNAPDFSEPLLRIARNESYSAGLRLEALAALRNGLRPDDSAIVNFVRAQIDPTKPVQVRGAAASVLANAKLNEEQLLELVETAKIAGPLELTKLLGAFEHSSNESVGLKLLAALKESKSLASLRPDVIKTLFAKYPPAVQEKGNGLITMVNADAEKQSAHLEDLLGALKDGDVRRGQIIFNSPKAACFSCHKLGYLGGTAGPDLTSIGQVRTERDLLESIIYPSASFVRSYEPVIVMTKSDEQYNGVVRKDAANELVLATGPNTEARIARADIADIKPGTVSIMPAGLDQQLSKQELADLLAFLKATKWGPR